MAESKSHRSHHCELRTACRIEEPGEPDGPCHGIKPSLIELDL
jgi:hypothetical protein